MYYIVDLDKMRVVGGHQDEDQTFEIADASDVNFTVVNSDIGFKVHFSNKELLLLYKNLTNSNRKSEFSSKSAAVSSILHALESIDIGALTQKIKPKRRQKSKKQAKKPTVTRKDIVAKNKAVKKQPTKTKSKQVPTRKAKSGTIGSTIIDCLQQGMPDDDILRLIHSKFPGAKTTKNSCAYYRSKLNKGA